MLSPLTGFVGFLALTVILLASTVATGLLRKLRVHLTLVAFTVASLATTIYYAEQLGKLYDLKAAGAIMDVHLALAKLATASYLAPVLSGIATLRNRSWRKLHFKLAIITVVLTLLSAGTGLWMILAAKPLQQG